MPFVDHLLNRCFFVCVFIHTCVMRHENRNILMKICCFFIVINGRWNDFIVIFPRFLSRIKFYLCFILYICLWYSLHIVSSSCMAWFRLNAQYHLVINGQSILHSMCFRCGCPCFAIFCVLSPCDRDRVWFV